MVDQEKLAKYAFKLITNGLEGKVNTLESWVEDVLKILIEQRMGPNWEEMKGLLGKTEIKYACEEELGIGYVDVDPRLKDYLTFRKDAVDCEIPVNEYDERMRKVLDILEKAETGLTNESEIEYNGWSSFVPVYLEFFDEEQANNDHERLFAEREILSYEKQRDAL